MLTDEERKALVANKVERSHTTWGETQGIIEREYWYAAANRMYYSCYYRLSIQASNCFAVRRGASSVTRSTA